MTDITPDQHNALLGMAVAFLLSLTLTGFIIPKILLIAFRKKLFDVQDERKQHQGLVPRLGGIAFVPAVIFSVAAVIGLTQLPSVSAIWSAISPIADAENMRVVCFGLCGLLLLYLTGVADDLIGVLYRAKFIVQLVASLCLIVGGIWITDLHGFCGVHAWSDTPGIILTVLVSIFFINSINLIDGIDGLASGLSAVALGTYGTIFAIEGDWFNAVISFATLGTLVQFFYYNVFGKTSKRKKIFMGDTGSLCIGFILTYLSVVVSRFSSFNGSEINPIVVAFAPMLIPCMDVLRVFFYRIRKGKNPFLPDRTHIHYKLLRLGMSTPKAMVSIILISIGLILFNVFLSPVLNAAILLTIDLILWMVFNYCLSSHIRALAARGIIHHENR